MFLFLLLTRFQGTLPHPPCLVLPLWGYVCLRVWFQALWNFLFCTSPLTWTLIYKISHLFSLFSPLRVSPSCFHILPSLEPLSLLLFLWNPCLILGSGGLQSLHCWSWMFISPYWCLFMHGFYYFLPPFVSCMVFGVCVETFIFQQLTLS